MTVEIATLGYRVDSSTLVPATKQLDALTAATQRTQTAADNLNLKPSKWKEMTAGMSAAEIQARRASTVLGTAAEQAAKMEKASGGLTERMREMMAPLRNLQTLFAATFGAKIVKDTLELADQFAAMRARLAVIVGDDQLDAVFKGIIATAKETRGSLDATATLFTRIGQYKESLGRSNEELLKFVEVTQKAFTVGGSTANETENALRQLSQALGNARGLSGDEFRSLSEQGQFFMKMLAEGMGVPIEALRQMARDGKITRDVLIEAILKMEQQVDQSFGKMPVTVGQAMQQLHDEILVLVGELNSDTGFTGIAVAIIQGIGAAARGTATDIRGLVEAFKAVKEVISSLNPFQTSSNGKGPSPFPGVGILGDQAKRLMDAVTKTTTESVAAEMQVEQATEQTNETREESIKLLQDQKKALEELSDITTGFGGNTDVRGGPLGDVLGFAPNQLAEINAEVAEFQRALQDVNAVVNIADQNFVSWTPVIEDAAAATHDAADAAARAAPGFTMMAESFSLASDESKFFIESMDALSLAQEEFARSDERSMERQARRSEKLMLEPFTNAARSIQSVFADTFENILNGGISSMEDIANAGSKIFNRMAAEMGAAVLMKPIMGAMDSMNKSGGSFLGIGSGTWGGLGMVGGNIVLDKVLGQRKGSFADIGSMVGGLAGSSFGPLGMIGGSLLGNVFGGMFGKSSAGPSGRANLTVNNGQFGLGTFATDNGGDPAQMVAQVNAVAANLNAFMSKFGLSAGGGGWVGALGFGSNSGGVGTPEELLAQALRSGAIQGSGSIGTALRNTRQTSLEGIGADLEFAKLYDELVKLKPETTAVEAEVANLTKQFAEAKDRAAGLGLSVAALDQAFIETIRKMRRTFNEGVQLAILGILDPDAAAMKQLEQLQDQRRKDAIALGADLVAIDRLSGLERKQLLEDQAAAMKQTFEGIRRLMDDMAFGGLSPASSSDRLAAIQEKFMEVEARALGGDAAARAEFDSVARQYLDIARENFASSEGFQSIFDRVFGSAEAILGAGSSGLGASNDNVATAVMTGTDNIVNVMQAVLDEVAGLREENRELRSDLQQFVAGQQAAGGRAA